MTASTESDIRALIERAEHALDHGGPDDYAAAFADEGVLITPSKTAHGRAAIREAIAAMAGFLKSHRHRLGASTITVSGREATALTQWEVRDAANGERIWATGIYRDRLARGDNGDWLLAVRIHEPDRFASRANP